MASFRAASHAGPLLLLSLAFAGCSGPSALPRWLGGEPPWYRDSGLRRDGGKVLVVGRSQEKFGFKDAVEAAVHDGHRQIAEAILTRVESETTDQNEIATGSPLGARISGHFEVIARSTSEANLRGFQVEDAWTRVHRTDVRGREIVEASARVSIPIAEFDEAVRRTGEELEARLLADHDLAFGLAEAAYERGDRARSQKIVEGLLRRDPDDHRLRLFYAQVLEADGRAADARREYGIVARIDPDGADGLSAAAALARLDRPPGAAPAPARPAGPPPPAPPKAPAGKTFPPLGEPWTVARASGPIRSVAFNRDLRLLAFGGIGEGGKVTVIDVESGQAIDERDGAAPVAWNRGGNVLAFAGLDGAIVFADVGSGRTWRTVEAHPGGPGALAFSADDRTLFSGGGRSVRRWRVDGGTVEAAVDEGGEVSGLAYNPLEGLVAAASLPGTVRVLRAADAMAEVRSIDCPDEPRSVALSLDGTQLAFGTRGAVHVYILAGDAPPTILPRHAGWVRAMAFSPGGTFLAAGDASGKIRVWDVPGRKVSRTFAVHEGDVLALHMAPGGRLLASGGADGRVAIIRLR